MADLNEITITVYVPEDRYGQISLGQQAEVTVDSFPGETFTAEVIHIADEAEFTPRNVQTVEGRSSTVYAIRLKVTDSEGRLKIGMPADVVFK
jgi:HlyD family secretion protein